MNKALKYGLKGALILGGLNALKNARNQLTDKVKDDSFNWSELLKEFGKGALVGVTGGLILGAIRDNNMAEMLIEVGGSRGLIKEVLAYTTIYEPSLLKKAQKIQYEINKQFGSALSEYPSIGGSTIKGTSIQGSDIDIPVRFKKYAGTIENIRDVVEDYFNENFNDKDLIEVRSQNHSIGLIFTVDGRERRIDVVPMRVVNNRESDAFIFSIERNTIKKTNIQKQTKELTFTEKQKQVIKVLKSWKTNNHLYFPSILIEYIVLRAFKEKKIPSRIDKSLMFIIRYIADNITRLRIVDPANSNNIISDTLTFREKEHLQIFCYKMIEDVANDERNFLDYF